MARQWQWDDVRIFLAVSHDGTFSGAARALGVDHVTVARRIASLEEHLGAKLLSRTPDGLETTPAGQAIIKQCESMEVAALCVERLIAGQDRRAAGQVRVTSTDAMADRFLIPVFVKLHVEHPELQVDLLTGVRKYDIARREADLAVRPSMARPSDAGLVCRKLGEVGFSLYASPKYLAKAGTPKRHGGLAGHDLIRFMGTPPLMGPPLMGESIEGARVSIRTNDHASQVRAAANGLGIADLPCYLGDECRDLVRLWPDEPPPSRPLWLIMHEDLRRAARVRIVATAISDAIERDSRLLRWGRAGKPR